MDNLPTDLQDNAPSDLPNDIEAEPTGLQSVPEAAPTNLLPWEQEREQQPDAAPAAAVQSISSDSPDSPDGNTGVASGSTRHRIPRAEPQTCPIPVIHFC